MARNRRISSLMYPACTGLPPGAVDAQHDARRVGILERAVERLDHALRRGPALRARSRPRGRRARCACPTSRARASGRPTHPSHADTMRKARMNHSSLNSAPHWRARRCSSIAFSATRLEDGALPLRRILLAHGIASGLAGGGRRSRGGPGRCVPWSGAARGSSPRHGPATQSPVAGSKSAPCVEQIKYSPVSSKNSPGCQSSSVPRCGQLIHVRARRAAVANGEALLGAAEAAQHEAHARRAVDSAPDAQITRSSPAIGAAPRRSRTARARDG